jgi:subtilisin family serine protease
MRARERVVATPRRGARSPQRLLRVDPPAFGATAGQGPAAVLIEYQAPPALQALTSATASDRQAAARAGRAAVARNRAAQQAARAALASLGVRELYSVQRVLNATVALAGADQLASLRSLPGVVRVSPAPIHRLDSAASVPFIGANTVWDRSGALGLRGLTGKAITLAIVDSGIDYLHLDFGGDADYASQTDVTSIADHPFPTAKVVGGYDFAGDGYDASGVAGSPTPQPDPDPVDCNGHGTHVAGTAAGFGVRGGATYAGSYDGLTSTQLLGFDIVPGVAPEASLIALKVFGCQGTTALTLAALERAVDPDGDGDFGDHYDVVNLSLSAVHGSGQDPTAQAASNAALAGVVVVGSAGNGGDAYFATGGPAAGASAISVAASADGGESAIAVVDLAGKAYPAFPARFGAPLSDPLPSPTTAASLRPPPHGPRGCLAADFEDFPAGAIAIVDSGGCSAKQKALNALGAGALAVILDDVTTCAPFAAEDDPKLPAPVTVPVVTVSCSAAEALLSQSTLAAQINPDRGFALGDAVAEFSSRGPRRPDPADGRIVLKPDLTAPGVGIASARTGYNTGPGDGRAVRSGTSMAAAHVAGTMVLLRQQHPDWPATWLKALVMNTASHDVWSLDTLSGKQGPIVGPSRVGAGRVDPARAVASPGVALSAEDPAAVSLAFAADVVGRHATNQVRDLLVFNRSGRPLTYAVSVQTQVRASGVVMTVSPHTLTVLPYASARVQVGASLTPALMLHDLEKSVKDRQGTDRHWMTEASGFVQLRPSSATQPMLRVPVYVAARPAAQMFTAPTPIQAVGGAATIRLLGEGVANLSVKKTPGGSSIDQQSLLSLFELLWSSPKRDAGDNAWDSADIRYLGLSPYGDDLAVATWDAWGSPAELQLQVCIDYDQDALVDYCFLSYTVPGTDVHVQLLQDVNGFRGDPGATYEWFFPQDDVDTRRADPRLLRSDVLTFPLDTDSDDFQLTGGSDTSPAFNFFVRTFHADDPRSAFGLPTDQSPTFTFDPAQRRLVFDVGASSVFPFYNDVFGAYVRAAVALPAGGSTRALLLHHFNAPGSRSEIVTVQAPRTSSQLLLNPGFDLDVDANGQPDSWQGAGLRPADRLSTADVFSAPNAFSFQGAAPAKRTLSQTVAVSGEAGDTLGVALRVDGGRLSLTDMASLTVQLLYTDGTRQSYILKLGRGMDYGLPRLLGPFTAAKPYAQVHVELSAKLGKPGSALFLDDVGLFRVTY